MSSSPQTSGSDHPDVARVAGLFADASRARILFALFDGRALPASVLAVEARVSASTVSEHLSKLADGGLVTVERHGRFRYFRLADPSVAEALESLTVLAPRRDVKGLTAYNRLNRLRAARTCYDHTAGKLGVRVLAWLHRSEALVRTDGMTTTECAPDDELSKPVKNAPYRLGPRAEEIFSAWHIDLDATSRRKRPLIKVCVDWTEQSHHLAGGLGAAVLASFREAGWIENSSKPREIRITDSGRDVFAAMAQ